MPIVPTLPMLSAVVSEEERKARLAYWIRDMRFQRHLTPPKLADLIGVSRSTVNKWESGDGVPSLLYLGPLARALRVDPRLFADLPEIPPSGAAEYLVAETIVEGQAAGRLRARRPRAGEAPSKPRLSVGRSARADDRAPR